MPGRRNVGRAFATLTLRNKQFLTGLLTAQVSLKTFKNIALVGFAAVSAAAIGVSAAILKIGKSSVSAATTFDRRAREINTLARLSADEFENMKQQIIGMSSRLGMDAVGMAQALYQINSACYKGAEGMKILKASTKLAVAGLADQESVANAVTTALRAWGISANNVTRVTDVMFKTVELGKIRIDEIAQGLGYTASIAAQAGLSIEQTSAAVAVLTKGGIQGTKAYMGVSQILSALIKPSEETKKAFDEIGISAKSIKEIGLIGVLQKIREASKGNIETLATFIPNIRALRGALVLTGSMMEDYEQNLTEIEKSTGATNTAFEEMNRSFARFKEIWGTRFRNAMIQLGERIIPTLQKSLEQFLKPENLQVFARTLAGVGIAITRALGNAPRIVGMLAENMMDLHRSLLHAQKAHAILERALAGWVTGVGKLWGEVILEIDEELAQNAKNQELVTKRTEEFANVLDDTLPSFENLESAIMGAFSGMKTFGNEATGAKVALEQASDAAENTIEIWENWSQGKPVGPFPQKIEESVDKVRALELAANAAGTALGTAFQKGINFGQRLLQIVKSVAANLARLLIPGFGGEFLGGFIQALPFQEGGIVPKNMPLVNIATYNENPNRPENVFGLPGGDKAVIPWDKMPQMVKAEVYVTNANPDTQVRTIIKANPDAMNELWRRGIRPAMERDNLR